MQAELQDQLDELGLHGVLLRWDEVEDAEWLPWRVEVEATERQRRSLERRIRNAKRGRFKPMADFDWRWPTHIVRAQVESLLRLEFLRDAANPIVVGPNGSGKSMLARNVAHAALMAGHTVRFTNASDMLNDLAAPTAPAAATDPLRPAPAVDRRRGRLPVLRTPPRRPAVQGRHPSPHRG